MFGVDRSIRLTTASIFALESTHLKSIDWETEKLGTFPVGYTEHWLINATRSILANLLSWNIAEEFLLLNLLFLEWSCHRHCHHPEWVCPYSWPRWLPWCASSRFGVARSNAFCATFKHPRCGSGGGIECNNVAVICSFTYVISIISSPKSIKFLEYSINHHRADQPQFFAYLPHRQ